MRLPVYSGQMFQALTCLHTECARPGAHRQRSLPQCPSASTGNHALQSLVGQPRAAKPPAEGPDAELAELAPAAGLGSGL
eukprot:13301565-Alexandrium_andersonii.AAC.1